MRTFPMSTWADLSEECPLRFEVAGSGQVSMLFGEGHGMGELVFDLDAIHELVRLGTAAAAEMEARYEREEESR